MHIVLDIQYIIHERYAGLILFSKGVPDQLFLLFLFSINALCLRWTKPNFYNLDYLNPVDKILEYYSRIYFSCPIH